MPTDGKVGQSQCRFQSSVHWSSWQYLLSCLFPSQKHLPPLVSNAALTWFGASSLALFSLLCRSPWRFLSVWYLRAQRWIPFSSSVLSSSVVSFSMILHIRCMLRTPRSVFSTKNQSACSSHRYLLSLQCLTDTSRLCPKPVNGLYSQLPLYSVACLLMKLPSRVLLFHLFFHFFFHPDITIIKPPPLTWRTPLSSSLISPFVPYLHSVIIGNISQSMTSF